MPRRLLFTGLLMLFAALTALARLDLARSQAGEGDLPPIVIDVWPLPGVELAPDEPVRITFDQPMNPESVKAAVSFYPPANAVMSAPAPDVFEFKPAAGWPRNTKYTVTVGGAAAQSGQRLQAPYTFEVRTIGPLEVTTFSPAKAADIAVDVRILIAFNRPVVPLESTTNGTQSAPIRIQPPVLGRGEWVNTSLYAFTPDDTLAGATTYTVTVERGLIAQDGALLDAPFSWQFTTLPPGVDAIRLRPDPQQPWIEYDLLSAPLNRPIEVKFNQRMERASAEAAFTLSQAQAPGVPVPGRFAWEEGDTLLVFSPDGLLSLNTAYIVTISTAARSAGGGALPQATELRFQTVPYPAVQDSIPPDGSTDLTTFAADTNISIFFNAPMNGDTLKSRVEIAPATSVYDPFLTGDGRRLMFYALLRPNTRYTVTLKAGGQDVYGNALSEDYRFTFTTGPSDYAYPIINGDLMVTGAHHQDTRVVMAVSGQVTLNAALYGLEPRLLSEVPISSSREFNPNGYYNDTRPDEPQWVTPSNLVRIWQTTLATPLSDRGAEGRQAVWLASDAGGKLPPGLYWVDLRVSGRAVPANRYRFALAVSTASLTLKRGINETLIWLTDMPTAKPLNRVPITVYHSGKVIATGLSGPDGVLRVPVALPSSSPDGQILVLAEAEGVFGVWSNRRMPDAPTEKGYLYTDRPIYRPGEIVRLRGAVRAQNDMTFSLPEKRTVKVAIDVNGLAEWGGKRIYEADLPLTDFGTLSAAVKLPQDVPLGFATIRLEPKTVQGSPFYPRSSLEQLDFQIGEFRVPEFEVSVTSAFDEIVQGDPLEALARASYYFGGPVGRANLTWSLQGTPEAYHFAGREGFSFYDETWQSLSSLTLDQGTGQTDADGRAVIRTAQSMAPMGQPVRLSLEATVRDESGQSISARVPVFAHPSGAYVGVRTLEAIGGVGKPVSVEVLTLSPDNLALPARRVDLEVVEVRWNFNAYEPEIVPVTAGQAQTGADGIGRYSFTPPRAGIYRIRAVTADERGRVASSTTRLYVTGGSDGLPIQFGPSYQGASPVVARESYKPGEVAEMIIPLPNPGKQTVLIAAERGKVMRYEVIEAEGPSLIYRLPITDEFAPTVYVSVSVVVGILSPEDPNPAYASGLTQLRVEPVARRLNVRVTPSETQTKPRDEVRFDVSVTDSTGRPTRAEVGLALVDKAVLALASPNSVSIEEGFYSETPLWVITDSSDRGLLDLLTNAEFGGGWGGGGGGGGAAEAVSARTDFEYTPLWAPHVVTGPDGRASVSVRLPDNLTTWRLDARALTVATDVGQTDIELLTTLPLIIRPAVPRFLVAGDRVQLAAVINNNTGIDQVVEATLQAKGVELTSRAGAWSQQVRVAAGSRARVVWDVLVNDVPGVDLTFIVVGQGGYQDAAKPALTTGPENTIPVYHHTVLDTAATAGVLQAAGSRTEAIVYPPRLRSARLLSGSLDISLNPSLAAAAFDALDYLEVDARRAGTYVEYAISRLLSNAAVARALRSAQHGDLGDPALEANLSRVLNTTLASLKADQNEDGGWGWVSGTESDSLVTAYAAFGLVEARDSGLAGLEIDAAMLDRAVRYLRENSLIVPEVSTPDWQLNRQAFVLYVLARVGGAENDPPRLDALFQKRARLSRAASAYLLMAYHLRHPDSDAVPALRSDLIGSAILSATGAHWEEPQRDAWNWGSDTRTTAIVLTALLRAAPQSDLLPDAVRWLMTARRADHWQTAQENAWALFALSEWLTNSDELRGGYQYSVTLNRKALAQGMAAPNNVRETKTLSVAVGDLLADAANRLIIARGEGPGALYYTARLNLNLLAESVQPTSRGITVDRQYFRDRQPVTSARVGDLITVRLTLVVPQDVHFLVLEDPIPAGTEPVDPRLLTSTQDAPGPELSREDPFWFWNWFTFDRTEQRDSKTLLYADYLPRGTYIYSYQVRATTPGGYQVLPARAYEVYFPEVFGHTAGTAFTVTEAQ